MTISRMVLIACRMLAALCVMFGLAAPVGAASAGGYGRIVLAPTDPVDPDLTDLMADASDALWRFASSIYGGGAPQSPAAEVFAAKVTIFVGGDELTAADRFDERIRVGRDDVLAELGRMLEAKPISQAGAEARGAERVRALIADGLVGPNAMLENRICTASFARISHEEMSRLLAGTETEISDWGVARFPGEAAEFHRGAGPGNWVTGQLLYVDRDAPAVRSCCWESIVTPDGLGRHVQTGFGKSPLVAYLASHACFVRTDRGWRIGAIALRRP